MSPENQKKESQQLRKILNEWDVLGVVDDGVEDEYDDINYWILDLLHKKADKNEIRNKLISILDNEYGLRSATYKYVNGGLEHTLDKIINWYYQK